MQRLVQALAFGAFLTLGVPVMSLSAQAADPAAGTWELNVESPMGSRASDAIFTQTGETLGGKMVSPRGEVPLTGTIDGDTVKFGINVNVQGQSLQIDYSGTVTGDTMSGTVVFGSFGDGKWTGKKKQ